MSDDITLPPLHAHDHPDPHTMRWSDRALRAIRDYARAAVEADRAQRDALGADPVVWMSRADWDAGERLSPVYCEPRAADDVPLYTAPPALTTEPVALILKGSIDALRKYGHIEAPLYAPGYEPEQEWAEPLYTTPPDAREALAAAEASDAESIAMYRRCRDDRDRMRKAMRLALEALSRFMDDSPRPSDALFGRQAIDALRAALEARAKAQREKPSAPRSPRTWWTV